MNDFVKMFGGDDVIETLTKLTDAVKNIDLKWTYIGGEPEPGPTPDPSPGPSPDPSPGPCPPYPDGSEHWREIEDPVDPEPPTPDPDPEDDKDYNDNWRELEEPTGPEPTPEPEPVDEPEDDGREYNDNWRELSDPEIVQNSNSTNNTPVSEPEVVETEQQVTAPVDTFVPDNADPYINTNWRQLQD
jgi:hypothetical protein